MKALIRDEWKYIRILPDQEELYHLGRDPGEMVNESAGYHEVVRRMRADLTEIEGSCARFETESRRIGLDPVMQGRLKSLGYIR